MRRIVLCGMILALAACGKHSQTETVGTYFVPRSVAAKLPDAKVIGTHDSGLLVNLPINEEQDLFSKSKQSFRFDKWQPEQTAYNFAALEQKVQELARDYPNLVSLDTYGTSRQGRPEYVLSLTDKNAAGPKTELMITAATHGDEVATVDVVLGLTDLLLQGNGNDPRLTAMLAKHVIHIVPAVCVDSYVARTRYVEGQDPNRQYPYPNQPTRNPVSCVKDIMAFVDSHNIVGTLDYHDAASMVFFPWAYTYNAIPQADYAKLDDLTTRMAASNGFEHGQIAQTIYVAPGSSADYYYWKHHAAATAIELSHELAVAGNGTNGDLVEESREATWTFIEGASL